MNNDNKILSSLMHIKDKSPIYSYRYSKSDVLPIVIGSPNYIKREEKEAILRDYYSKGFCFIKFGKVNSKGEESVNFISRFLNLGNPFIPEYFKDYHGKEIIAESGINTITAKMQSPGKVHNAFASSNSQNLHVDGTVTSIGLIKTSILFCDQPASLGGENTLFNAVSAFTSMCENDSNSIYPLLNENALLRKHSAPGSLPHYGPVFKITDYDILNRFSIDNTSYWEEGFNKVENLREAFNTLNSYTKNGEFMLKIRLERNCALILSNDKISHGRKSFIDQDGFRTMFRGLFTNKPI